MILHDFRFTDAERYRNVPEWQIVQFLCSPFEIAAGRAKQETSEMQKLLDHLVVRGLPFRSEQQNARLFDLAEVVNFIKYAYFTWGEPVWLERSVATLRRLFQENSNASKVQPRKESKVASRGVAVTITRSFAPGFLRSENPSRLHMPKPLNALPGSLRVEWLRCDGVMEPPADEGARHFVKVLPDLGKPTVLSVRQEFVPGSEKERLDVGGSPPELYLREREGLVAITSQVVALASRLGLSAGNPWRSLQRIWDYLFDEISFGFIHYDRLADSDPLAWAMENRRVDCRTGSALIVALCRAVGIPARMLNGYTLNPVLPTSHTWLEAWMPGNDWVPFDTYSLDLAGGVRDSPWREHFFGKIDERFVSEVLPKQFCGLGKLRLPRSWQLSMGLGEAGATSWYYAVDGFAPLYSESVAIQRL